MPRAHRPEGTGIAFHGFPNTLGPRERQRRAHAVDASRLDGVELVVSAQDEGDEAAGVTLDQQRLEAAFGGNAEKLSELPDGVDVRSVDGGE